MSKQYANLLDRVASARQAEQPLNICGAGSKSFYGRQPRGEELDVRENQGIIEYDPAELVIVAHAGTPLAIIQAALAEKKQMLGFEPPYAAMGATLGGAVASGLSGAGRPYRGAIRDYLLGVKLINGKAELNQFGGRVMKNVAGFDLFRPMAGAMGTLGVLLELSLRVMPIPERERDLQFDIGSQAEALQTLRQFDSMLSSLSASSWDNGTLRIRLSGSRMAVDRDQSLLRRDHTVSESDPNERLSIAQLTHSFFDLPDELSCIMAIDLPPATAPLQLEGEWLLDWGGARRYLKTRQAVAELRPAIASAGGSATLLVGGDRSDCFHPLDQGLLEVHKRFKHAFDPGGIFNPGRLYAEL